MSFGISITYLGPKDVDVQALFKKAGVAVSPVAAGKIRRYLSLQNIVDVPKFFIGFFQALAKLYIIMPDVVFSKGGTGAFPVVLAGWFYRIPIVIHDSDAKPGLTNLASSFFAKRIFISFDAAAKYFNPDDNDPDGSAGRAELFANPTTKELAKETLGFDPGETASCRARRFAGIGTHQNFILANLAGIMKETQILHQAGSSNFSEVKRLSDAALLDAPFTNRYEAVAYLDDKNLSLALMGADVAVSRAGNATLSELAAFGVPAMLIPHEGGSNGHQRMNAYDFTKNGAGIVIEEANLLSGIFISEIKKIISDPELRQKMSFAAKQFFVPNAAETIVEGILEAVAK